MIDNNYTQRLGTEPKIKRAIDRANYDELLENKSLQNILHILITVLLLSYLVTLFLHFGGHMSLKQFFISLFICTILFIPQLSESKLNASTHKSQTFIDLLLPQTMELEIGDEVNLLSKPYVYGAFTFKSSKSSVACVDDFGVITAKKAGTSTITVKYSNSSIKFKVIVLPTTVTLSKTSITLEPTNVFQLTAIASNGSKVTYTSSKKSIATIDENGTITAIKPGDTVITATADTTKVTCKITVKPPTIQLNKSSVSMFRNGTFTLSATVSNQVVPTYKSSHKSVATVDTHGNITALKHGITTITATVNGVSTTCIVTVKQPTITLSNTELTLTVGELHALSVRVSSGNKPTFQSSKSTIVSVDANGLLTAKKQGSAYITISEDGVKTKCKVTVLAATLTK